MALVIGYDIYVTLKELDMPLSLTFPISSLSPPQSAAGGSAESLCLQSQLVQFFHSQRNTTGHNLNVTYHTTTRVDLQCQV